MKIAAGIVLYNPDLVRLERNVKAVIAQVEEIFVVNNGNKITDKDLKDKYIFLKNKKISIINNANNFGIAKALNQIIKQCLRKKYEWVLLLDQDSVAENGLIEKMIARADDNVSIVAPRIVDLNKRQKRTYDSDEAEDVDMAITSGSLIRVNDCKELGMFDERMFIDFVDFDYCKRVRLAGKRIVRVNDAKLEHEIGKRIKRRFLWVILYPTNHHSDRVYYYGRNLEYYKRKYQHVLSVKERLYLMATKAWKTLTIVLYEDNK